LGREALASIGISRGRVPGGQAAGHVASDGRRQRGSATVFSPGAHLVAAFRASLEDVIGQLPMEPEAKEITASLQLLKTLPLTDVTVTGDAMFTQREIYRVIRDDGFDYFFTVKDNQPALKADIALGRGPTSLLRGMVAVA
jgi:hypothetical protein